MMALQLIFWICLLLVIYSYLLFPFVLRLLSGKRVMNHGSFTADKLPLLSVLMAAYNEERHIAEKIDTLLDGSYPQERVEIWVGSDASTDNTNLILKQLSESHPSLHIILFKKRTGKPGIINQLAQEARGEILVITDANVMLEKSTLSELIRPFSNREIGLVDSLLINTGIRRDGISVQEKFYTGREVRIKRYESLLWGSMMGPFGGCYAVRKSLYKKVPGHFLVDDFFINMSVLEQGARSVSQTGSRVYEEVSNNPREEFRRKKRISAGNFQNLCRFSNLLFRGRNGIGFCFFSHKVIRWIVPFLVIITLATSSILSPHSSFFLLIALLQAAVLITPVIDHILRKIGIHSLPLRFISHLVLMNLALLAGFFRFLGGIENNVWEPTRRDQNRT